MLTDICNSINNHFAMNRFSEFYFQPEQGSFKIENGILTGVKDKPIVGAYFAITGSILNNGVYLSTDNLITLAEARNEEFDGVIYRLVVPSDFIRLVERIKTFSQSEDAQASNIVSASFGIQSVSYAVGSNGVKAGWQTVFKQELHKYRRMFIDIEV